MVSMVIGPQISTVLKPWFLDCTLELILESGWLRTSLSMSGFRDKQRTLVNTVGVPSNVGSSPGKGRGGMTHGPTTKLIIQIGRASCRERV